MEVSSVNGRINALPQLVLTDIFEQLNTKDKFSCASVCKKWQEILLSNKCLTLWNVLTLHIKPQKGRYAKNEHEFHLQMCKKYLTRAHTLILYVCNCQEENLTSLGQVRANSSYFKQKCVIFRRSFNKCCRESTIVSFSDYLFTEPESNVIMNLRYLKNLSFGFDCNVNILNQLWRVFSAQNYFLSKLNVSSLSCCMKKTNLDLSWLCELNEVTINFETLTERTLQSWIRRNSCRLKKLRIVFLDTTVEEYFNKQNVIVNTCDMTKLENFPTSQTWSELKTIFPSLKIQLIFVAPSIRLEYLLRTLPFKVPFEDIIIIFRLYIYDQSFPFQQWFNQQDCSQLSSVAIHGLEHTDFYSFSSTYSESWLDFFCNKVTGIEYLKITGLFVTISKLREYVDKPTLRNLHVSRHDLVVDSQVQRNLQVKPSLTQVSKYEKFVSEKLNRNFKCDMEVPFQEKYKEFSLLDKSKGILQKEEDMQMILM